VLQAPVSFPATRQSGAALLVFMLIALIGILSVILNRLSSITPASRSESTMQKLAQAKEAIVSWSASHPKLPGKLPCPEDITLIGTPNEGNELSSCPGTQVGRLPWRTLGLPDLRDDAGELLWYALSPGFRNSPINSDTPAQLTVDGVGGSAVAIVFSAGPPLSGQNRPVPTASTPLDVTQYLDSLNNNGTGNFITTGASGSFNDRLLVISPRDLFSAVEKRVGQEVRRALLNQFCGLNNFNTNGSCIAPGGYRYFPRPAAFNDTTCLGNGAIGITNCISGTGIHAGRIPANPSDSWFPATSLLRGTIGSSSDSWFQTNGWRELVYYSVTPSCTDGTVDCSGVGNKLTVKQPSGLALTNKNVVIIITGNALSATASPQVRAASSNKTNIANYLEDENLLPLDDVYTRVPITTNAPFNDQVFSIP
jgi:hypothetical protein